MGYLKSGLHRTFQRVSLGAMCLLYATSAGAADDNRFLFSVDRTTAIQWFVEKIPENATMASSNRFLPLLSSHQHVVPLQNILSRQNASANSLDSSLEMDYLLIDFDEERAKYSTHDYVTFLGQQWKILDSMGSIVLFAQDGGKLLEPRTWKVNLNNDEPYLRLDAQVGDDLMLVGFTMASDSENVDIIRFEFYWKKTKTSHRKYMASLDIMDSTGRVVKSIAKPFFHGLFPFSEWGVGEVFKEEYAFVVPAHLDQSLYTVHLSVMDEDSSGALVFETDFIDAVDREGRIKLVALDAISE